MKIKPEDYKELETRINNFVETNIEACKQHFNSHNITRVSWDFAHAAGCTPFICDTLYKYLNDEHINTALKAIVKNIIKGK